MNISQRGLDLIKGFEGCVLTAYQDAVGVWTIGYGHTRGVQARQKITAEQAEEYLREDCARFEKNVSGYDNIYHWNQNEFDALVSFAFNIGSINQLTANGTRNTAVIADKMLEYNKAGGKVLKGLTERRKKERELFITPTGKTQTEVKSYALNATDWIYVWGANGKPLTKEYAEILYQAYGSGSYTKKYYDNKLLSGEGKTAADCSGFLYPLSGADNTADGYYRNCPIKGAISTLPEKEICLVFKQNSAGTMHHVGIYLGDGTVAEMHSSLDNYKHWPIDTQGYTHWGKPSWIDYSVKEIVGKWTPYGEDWHYTKSDGTKAKDEWLEIDGRWYVFDGSGKMIKGWFKENDGNRIKWYYLNPADGAMLSSQWTDEIDGKYYYLAQSGEMAHDGFVPSKTTSGLWHYIGTDGSWIPEKDLLSEELKIYN